MNIHPERLREFCSRTLAGAGVPPGDAARIADMLVDADLHGVDTHGVTRLPVYISCLRRGRFNPRPSITLERAATSLGRVDGDNGLGLLVGARAMEFALELADSAGAGFVAVRNSSHFGAASYFCRMASRAGKIGMAFTNSPPAMPAWGAKAPYFGTNPIAFSFPGKDGQDVVIDLSTSVTARGHIFRAAREGKPIPEGWAVDSDGRPTTDAAKALEGTVLPMAGAKGYALALAVEIFAGILTGAAWGAHVGWMNDAGLDPVNVGHAFLAIDVAPLMALDVFQSRLAAMTQEIRDLPLAEGYKTIKIPGERGRNTVLERQQAIALSDALVAELDACAKSVGAPALQA